MGIYGQDWASYQDAEPDVLNLSFANIKATEGLGYSNPKFAQQRAHAEASGLVVGLYHYPHMGNDPAAEADYFLKVAQPKAGEFIALDWEGYDAANKDVPKSAQVAYRDAWLKHVKAALPHTPVGLYANLDYWLNVDTTSTCGDFLWIATAGRPAGAPGIQHDWLFHQYGNGDGLDRDYCRLASTAELRAWVAGFLPKPAPAPVRPSVSLANVISAARSDPQAAQGAAVHRADVLPVEQALVAEGLLQAQWADGSFGTKTVAAYGAWQRRCGYTGTDADGIPGRVTLAKLGDKHGFTIH
jgi:hypothetical protein